MRVLVLCDEMFASREGPLLARLEVGLADEGVGTVHAVPETAAPQQNATLFTQSVTYEAHGSAITRRVRARHLVRRLRERFGEDARVADIVHAFGGSVWSLALELGDQLDAAVVLEVWRSGLVGRAAAMSPAGGLGPIFMAPDTTIERELVAQKVACPVRTAPWGVHVPDEPHAILSPERAPSLMFVGTGRDSRRFCAAIEGVVQLLGAHPDLMMFLDAKAAHRSGAWGLAQRLNVGSQMTLIEDFEARRDLLLQGDALIVPEAGGEQRTILLDAMASGMLVIAREDPGVSALIDGRTARLVRDATPGGWTHAIGSLLSDPATARSLVHSARAFVRAERLASAHVAAVLRAYSWIGSDASLTLPPRG